MSIDGLCSGTLSVDSEREEELSSGDLPQLATRLQCHSNYVYDAQRKSASLKLCLQCSK